MFHRAALNSMDNTFLFAFSRIYSQVVAEKHVKCALKTFKDASYRVKRGFSKSWTGALFFWRGPTNSAFVVLFIFEAFYIIKN